MSEVLLGMRLRGASYSRLRLSPPFGVAFGPEAGARFHFIGQGEALLLRAGEEARRLRMGDAVLIPRGGRHVLASAPGVALRPYAELSPQALCPAFWEVRDCDAALCRSRDAVILTGAMELDLVTLHPLVALMPDVMSVGALLERQPEMRALLAAMETEMGQDRAGSAGVLARLADVIAALIVRAWVESGCDEASGVIAALQDPRLGRVLAALHRDPGRDWDIPAMAELMGASRSVLAERFTAVVGVPPLRYVTDLRMRLAAQWIGRDGQAIAVVADRLGYGSQAAFARAFRRVTGQTPGDLRRRGAGV